MAGGPCAEIGDREPALAGPAAFGLGRAGAGGHQLESPTLDEALQETALLGDGAPSQSSTVTARETRRSLRRSGRANGTSTSSSRMRECSGMFPDRPGRSNRVRASPRLRGSYRL